MVEHAVAEKIVPGAGKKPESCRHVGANGRTLRPWGPVALATLHFPAHLGVHLLKRHVADPLLGHVDFLLGILATPLTRSGVIKMPRRKSTWPSSGSAT